MKSPQKSESPAGTGLNAKVITDTQILPPAEKTGKSDVATQINAAHQQAIAHADKAINFAKQAGDLLLLVKADLAHGEFLPWVENNLDVTPRQAQRYMAAAQGKPLPISAIKCDTVSHLIEPQIKIVDVKCKSPKEKLASLVRMEESLDRVRRQCYFSKCGKALRIIRDKKLYLERSATFEGYLLSRWEMEPEDALDYLVLWVPFDKRVESLSQIGGAT
jgi:hypothetical protein